jgi:hypothetical protein
MWATVLVLALWLAADPIRLAVAVCLVSRPRPLVNLLAYWLGGMTAGLLVAFAALVLLREFVPAVVESVTSTVGSFTGGYGRIGLGVLVLMIAAWIVIRAATPQRLKVSAAPAMPVELAPQACKPNAFSRLSAGADRIWQSGHPGVAFVAGLGSALPPVESMVALAVILSSGAALGSQLSAAVMFTVVVLFAIEIPLLTYLVTPTKTQAVMLAFQAWLRAHSRPLLAAMTASLGVLLVVSGVGGV